MTLPEPPLTPERCPLARRARAALALTAALAAAAGAALAWDAAHPDRAARRSLYRLAGGPGPGLGAPPRPGRAAVEAVPAGAFFQPPEMTNTGPVTRHGN